MSSLYTIVAAALLLCLIAGLARVIKGPENTDRMLCVQLFSTTGVGFLLILFVIKKDSAILDTALVMALLGSLVFITYGVFKQPGGQANDHDSE
ncbi:hypothetical protein HHX48_04190 [Salinimonas sp. HHU 13199]|uniref:Multiple resistance and pH regulation protein F n=1 Tax=Salinimonas profundi TaxID=2729140 RepID=A0ABR8LJ25_9ALTE|nr:monovalent cation/H+ antiporter complex subunit F [Salinimonas profundi]MBD3584936.1 hypothetical protein [Salinimonas profundi]